MVSWRNFIRPKGTIGSSDIVACSVVMQLPHSFDESNQPFEFAKVFVELSAAEAAIRRLAEAISATKRRVNSLENIVVPRIENTIRYIEMSLQERSREDFFRLKRIKTRLEEEEEETVRVPQISS